MSLEELVEVLPHLGHPVDDLSQVVVPGARLDLRLDQFPPQVATQETLNGLHVVSAQHPPGGEEGLHVY